MNSTDLRQYILDNPKLVTMRESTRSPGLFVLKYTRKVFYDGLWDDYLENCRGTVVDADFAVVSRPFTKIYNFRVESKAPVIEDSTMVTAYRKINGFMCAITLHNDKLLISTTGSLDSEFVDMARSLIDEAKFLEVCRKYPNYTFMFECVHKSDPHIIPEQEGMYLLGWRANTWDSVVAPDPQGLSLFAAMFGSLPVESMTISVGELVQLAKEVQHEGFVAYTADNKAFKIKSPHYLCLKALARKKDILSLNKQLVDEEYFNLVSHLNEKRDEFNALPEQERLSYIREYLSQ